MTCNEKQNVVWELSQEHRSLGCRPTVVGDVEDGYDRLCSAALVGGVEDQGG